jgi:hypothetical protein
MFTQETDQGQKIFNWKQGPSHFRMLPEQGARLMSWDLGMAGGQSRPIIHWPADTDLSSIANVRGGNPILFPFSARTFHKGKIHTWKSPDGKVRAMPMHGFARDGLFEVVAVDDHSITLKLIPDSEDAEAYPFDYEFLVLHSKSNSSLQIWAVKRCLGVLAIISTLPYPGIQDLAASTTESSFLAAKHFITLPTVLSFRPTIKAERFPWTILLWLTAFIPD